MSVNAVLKERAAVKQSSTSRPAIIGFGGLHAANFDLTCRGLFVVGAWRVEMVGVVFRASRKRLWPYMYFNWRRQVQPRRFSVNVDVLHRENMCVSVDGVG